MIKAFERRMEILILSAQGRHCLPPFQKLGLIIIDEEHENSYKSETVPKYHAVEVAESVRSLLMPAYF